jgi:hypothetical protein
MTIGESAISHRPGWGRREIILPVPARIRGLVPKILGCTLTIGIVAITGNNQHIVTGSDRLISLGEGVVQGVETTLKNRKIAPSWGLMFAATDANLFYPIVHEVWKHLGSVDQTHDAEEIQQAVATVYRNKFDETFTSKYLVRYGFKSIVDFKAVGLSQFGDHKFQDICDAIDKFDLGITLLGYGFDKQRIPHVFQVDNPGHVTNHNLLGYAVIGSGYYMAMASLHRKKIPYHLEPLIYRVLEAKFSAETAPGVGKNTSLLWMDRAGEAKSIGYGSIDEIRNIWNETLLNLKRPSILSRT